MNVQHHDRITVAKDDEEIEVFNWVNISQPAIVRGIGDIEKFHPDIGAGDSSMKPDAVTTWVAEELWHEFGIEMENYDIEVIDVESDEIQIL